MKRKLALAAALFLIVSALVWGANYRGWHPPLSPADQKFRAALAGADAVEFEQDACSSRFGVSCVTAAPLHFRPADARQTRALVEQLRLLPREHPGNFATGSVRTLELKFTRRGQVVGDATLFQNARNTWLASSQTPNHLYRLHPRFEKSLRQLLDQIAPNRVKL